MTFSMQLSDDVIQVRDWVHEFAADVVRPAAAEWDEREETPWPIIQEAAKVGLYSLDLFGPAGRRALRPRHARPSSRSCSGATPASPWPSSAPVWPPRRSPGNGTPEQIGELAAADVRHRRRRSSSARSAPPSPTPDPTSAPIRTRARYDEATDEWVLNGTKTWATNGGIANVHVVVASVDPELGSRGQATFIIPPGTPGLEPGPEVQEARHPRLAHRRGRARRRPAARGPAPRRQGEARRHASPACRRGRQAGGQAAMETFERTRPTVGAMAVGVARAAYEYALDYASEREQFGRKIGEFQAIAFKLADMKSPHRRRPPAGVARRLDGAQRQAVRQRRGLDGQAGGQRDRRLRHR